MIRAIQDYPRCPRTVWMQKWSAQSVLNGSQVHWTSEVEECLTARGNQGAYAYYEQLRRQLDDMVVLLRGDISKTARVTIGSLAVLDVHARDVQKKLADAGVCSVTDFDWISQMRYYWEVDSEAQQGQAQGQGQGQVSEKGQLSGKGQKSGKGVSGKGQGQGPGQGDTLECEGDGDLQVIMVSSKRRYGYEYLGNTARLVITPLTDKCYLTLMGALQMTLGGAPSGPAGTGEGYSGGF
jgi:dynein heavy chain, axonemal